MKDINSMINEKFKNKDFEKNYHRSATFYRLADELLLLRKKRGLSQKELAEKAGTTQAVVSRLENASVKASLESVVNFAEALEALVDIHLVPLEEVRRKYEKQSNDYVEAPVALFGNLADVLIAERIEDPKKQVEWNDLVQNWDNSTKSIREYIQSSYK